MVAPSSGVSFERNALLAHLERDESDPVSRGELKAHELIENKQLQRFAEEFELKNPLARDLILSTDILDADL